MTGGLYLAGVAKLRRRGDAWPVGRTVAWLTGLLVCAYATCGGVALYDHALATYDAGDTYDHTAAVGFIKIWGLPVETAARKAPAAQKKTLVVSSQ